MILKREYRTLRERIRAMWEQRLDTMDMSKALQLPEHVIEYELHIVLETRRAIVSGLKPHEATE